MLEKPISIKQNMDILNSNITENVSNENNNDKNKSPLILDNKENNKINNSSLKKFIEE